MLRRTLSLLILATVFVAVAVSARPSHDAPVQVSPKGRYLRLNDGTQIAPKARYLLDMLEQQA